MQKSSPLPPVPLRRSHLDSGTYRTLVRILSHCIDDSLIHPPPPSNPSSTSNQSELHRCLAAEKEPVSDRNPNEALSNKSRLEDDDEASCARLLKDVACQNPRIHDLQDGSFGECAVTELLQDENPNFHLVEGLGHKETREGLSECPENELLRDLVSETSLSVEELGNGNSHGEQQKEPSFLYIAAKLDHRGGQEDDECPSSMLQNELRLEDPQLRHLKEEAFYSVEGLGHGEKSQGRCDESINRELLKKLADADPKPVNAPSTIFCSVEELGNGMRQDKYISSNPTAEFSGLMILGKDPICNSLGLIDEQEIEEGEIPDELGVPDQSLNLGFARVVLQEKKLVEEPPSNKGNTACLMESSKGECFDMHIMTGKIAVKEDESNMPFYCKRDTLKHPSTDDKIIKPQKKKNAGNIDEKESELGVVPDNSRLTAETLENISIQNGSKQSNTEDVEVCEKRKRVPLTEGRKEKKKLAKKRKRAEQNRKLGVKRLKLQPISKPQKVIYCNFYLKGRCQQGDLCKFSHDTIPLTKSQPCKYFACQSCLKGEDCPFDHELSKYPCHNYLSKGMCRRGDTCKFSHKMPITEGSSTVSMISKTDSQLSLEKSSLGKHLNMNNTSSVVNDPPETTALARSFPRHKHSVENLVEKNSKPPAKVPKGISFLSFGKETSDDTDKQQINKSLKRGDSIETHNQQAKVVLDRLQNSNGILFGSSGVGLSSRESFKSLTDGYKNAPSLVPKPPLQAQYKSNIMASRDIQSPPLNAIANKDSKTSTCSSGPNTTPCSGSLQNGLSDATKILEEFLFSGGI